jgi:hypothetical protein
VTLDPNGAVIEHLAHIGTETVEQFLNDFRPLPFGQLQGLTNDRFSRCVLVTSPGRRHHMASSIYQRNRATPNVAGLHWQTGKLSASPREVCFRSSFSAMSRGTSSLRALAHQVRRCTARWWAASKAAVLTLRDCLLPRPIRRKPRLRHHAFFIWSEFSYD